MKSQLYIATNGLGVWYSDDLGENLIRMNSRMGMYSGNHIWALANDPSDPNILLAGTNGGLFRLDRAKTQWSHMPSPMDERHKITALAFSPHNPDVMLAGTQFAAMYRSEDYGRTWRQLDLDIPEICSNKNQSRFTQIIFDTANPSLAWAGVELDYVWRSTDGGITWKKITRGIDTEDIHGLCVSNNNNSRRLLAATDRGIYTSDDDGESWEKGSVEFAVGIYARRGAARRSARHRVRHQRRRPAGFMGPPDAQPRQRRPLGTGGAARPDRQHDVVGRHESRGSQSPVRIVLPRPDLSQQRRRRELDRHQAPARGNPARHVAAELNRHHGSIKSGASARTRLAGFDKVAFPAEHRPAAERG